MFVDPKTVETVRNAFRRAFKRRLIVVRFKANGKVLSFACLDAQEKFTKDLLKMPMRGTFEYMQPSIVKVELTFTPHATSSNCDASLADFVGGEANIEFDGTEVPGLRIDELNEGHSITVRATGSL